ncbi:ParB/RepB/Spo0J family partition protein [Campylobacter sp. US33a]|uniref:ParB/RepB/Spo0J family partition protein n=1 Tax=Campylobacter sp. CCS1377 TaxID=3158229 RepID=A0AAU7E843_9BACT|nr:ParB/RepB/Spo0J family partition protein [Campylobacter sp. US33a]TEY03117.1 ParB/RepB/Spo0J family partition protein [Campylobacter sp. US33a]
MGLNKDKGLSSLISDMDEVYSRELGLDLDRVEEIFIDNIKTNPFQPRKDFDQIALNELAQSIQTYGLIQPIILLKKDENSYILIAGERRLRACKILGFDKIKAVVADIDENKLRELALIENIQRENLNPIELAYSYKDLIDEHKITQEELAVIVHKSRSQIANTLRLLTLDENTQKLIREGKISQGHAKVIAGLEAKDEKMLVNTILGQRLSVRDTEKIVQKMKNKHQSTMNDEISSELKKLQEIFNKLGVVSKVKQSEIVLSCSDVTKIRKLNKILATCV